VLVIGCLKFRYIPPTYEIVVYITADQLDVHTEAVEDALKPSASPEEEANGGDVDLVTCGRQSAHDVSQHAAGGR